MDSDDFSFDSSVWGAPAPAPSLLSASQPLISPSPATTHDQLDDFDDFHTPLESKAPSFAQDDDFADFGDFGEAEGSESTFTFENAHFSEGAQESSTSQLRSLRLNPSSTPHDLSQQIDEILGPLWPYNLGSLTSDEDIRQVEGIGQILTTAESRELYIMLLNSPPLVEPINWIRSRIRQQHLIALGLPVNLDEVLPRAVSKPLPPLRISTRPLSTPPSATNGIRSLPPSRSNSRAGTRSNTPPSGTRSGPTSMMQLSLGPKPELNEKKIDDLLKLDPDQLNLLPLSKLEKYLAELRSETSNTSTLLTYLLQTRDALQQDSETYNKLIAELVSEAQKTKTGKVRTGVKRSGTLH